MYAVDTTVCHIGLGPTSGMRGDGPATVGKMKLSSLPTTYHSTSTTLIGVDVTSVGSEEPIRELSNMPSQQEYTTPNLFQVIFGLLPLLLYNDI